MRFLKPALAATVALAVIALGSPAIGAGSSGGSQPATTAKKCKAKKGGASTAKKGCKGKHKGKGPAGSDHPKPTPPPVDPTGTTTIVLQPYSNSSSTMGYHSIHGSVSSNNNSCLSGRVLTLYEDLPVDQVLDTATVYAGSVIFDFPPQSSGDVFYAVATQDTVGSTSCGPATSNSVSKP